MEPKNPNEGCGLFLFFLIIFIYLLAVSIVGVLVGDLFK